MKTGLNFLGIPIEGDITSNSRSVTEQRPLSELEPLIRAVLDDPTIRAFGWTQYTPYFNDGDVCEFGVGTPWFLTVDDPDPEDVEDEYSYELSDYGDGHPSLGKRTFNWTGTLPDRERAPGEYTGPDEARYDRCFALSDAFDSGAFNDVLLEAFGDHAEVTVTATGITVDFYHHD